MKFVRDIVLTAMIAAGIIAAWSYQPDLTHTHAAGFPLQSTEELISLPSGTEIQATFPYGITESAKAGDSVAAFVSSPVTIGTQTAIPAGTQLNGTIGGIETRGDVVTARLNFSSLTLNNEQVGIQMEAVFVKIPSHIDLATIEPHT